MTLSDYTVTNMREAEDMAAKHGFDEHISARFPSRDLGLTKSAVSLQQVKPGKTQPFAHHHKEQEELYVIVAGSGRARLGDEEIELRAWDALRVGPDLTRAFAAGPDGLEFIAFGAPAVGDPGQDAVTEPAAWK
jgi:uncharacterized cupin superfamily protein